MQTNSLNCLVILIVFLASYDIVGSVGRNRKFKRKVDEVSLVSNSLSDTLSSKNETVQQRTGKGFFPHAGIFSLGKVLNFFPVGDEKECRPSKYTLARAGICLNPYDCRQRDGKATGDCAHGLGVCCVFEVSCGATVQNNISYFMSPGFPEFAGGDQTCDVTIEKAYAGIMQLRIDFVHFTIGQPNRTTGECDEDAMVLGEGDNKFVLCGQNHGQHIYYTFPHGSEKREAGELPRAKSTKLSIRMRSSDMPRLWLIRLTQLPLAHSAPHNCLQYYTGVNGTIKTFNYAVNGRHLAGQDYRACVRKNVGFCSISYSPCDAGSFRIGPAGDAPAVIDPAGTTQAPSSSTQEVIQDENDGQDAEEGSGSDPVIEPVRTPPLTRPGLMDRMWSTIWSYIWPWGQGRRGQNHRGQNYPGQNHRGQNHRGQNHRGQNHRGQNHRGQNHQGHSGQPRWGKEWAWRWSPYTQHYKDDDKLRYYGYGNFGAGLKGYGRQRCGDRITIPCENEYFISSSLYVSGVCDPHHCGNSLCPGEKASQCRIETSVSPFAVSVHFSEATPKRSAEENIGACLKYSQIHCDKK